MLSCIVFCDVSKVFDRVCHKGFFRIFFWPKICGSDLGPLLFLVYIHVNDIAKHLLILTRLFADDSSLVNVADIAGIINHDLLHSIH